jgi:hypothetical protein
LTILSVSTQWCQVKARRVIPTTDLLSCELKEHLNALYTSLLSYSPASMIGITENQTAIDDDLKVLYAISSVKIRSSGMVDCLTFTYVNGMQSKQHGGQGGIESDFPLKNSRSFGKQIPIFFNNRLADEYITEIITWSGVEHDSEWVYGIQFVTNEGRVSRHYGGTGGTPTVLKSKNGALVGLFSMTRVHPPSNKLRLSRIQVSDIIVYG